MKLAILHTTPATVQPLNELVKQRLPGVTVYNFVDDSILPMLLEDEASRAYAFEKMLCYVGFAAKQGAGLALNACSSVGGFTAWAGERLPIPVLRIDDAVSDLAVTRGNKIAVLATLPTTLGPSGQLLRDKGGPDVELACEVVAGAYEAGLRGDKEEQTALIAAAIRKHAGQADVVYLAQASMAAAAQQVPEYSDKILASTQPAMDALERAVQAMAAKGK